MDVDICFYLDIFLFLEFLFVDIVIDVYCIIFVGEMWVVKYGIFVIDSVEEFVFIIFFCIGFVVG